MMACCRLGKPLLERKAFDISEILAESNQMLGLLFKLIVNISALMIQKRTLH